MCLPAIRVQNVGKEYKLGQLRAAHTTLRDLLMSKLVFRRPRPTGDSARGSRQSSCDPLSR